MTNRSLYLHETVDIVGQGQYAYMEHLWKDPVLRMPDMFGLQGSFYVCAAGGGRWPQVINIWDIGTRGWNGWASNVDRMNLKRRTGYGVYDISRQIARRLIGVVRPLVVCQPCRRCLTMPETVLPSARPLVAAVTFCMTGPMAAMPVLPSAATSAIAWSMIAETSSSVSGVGR